MLQQLQHTAARLKLPFGQRKYTYNSRLAQELEKWAESEGKGDAYRHAVFRAYFAFGHNIARSEILIQIAEAIGLSGARAEQVLTERRYRDAVDRDWQQSKNAGISAVPTFRLNGDAVVGAQPSSVLKQLLTRHGVVRQNSN
jgi:predicted DsbA family dithiol-disulfide isomerase